MSTLISVGFKSLLEIIILTYKDNFTYLVRQFLVKMYVALTTVSASTQPAGTINNSPSGVNVNRRKNDRIVSS